MFEKTGIFMNIPVRVFSLRDKLEAVHLLN